MFTGIIEEIGTIGKLTEQGVSATIEIKASLVLEHTKLGDSIAVNGVCLTVTKLGNDFFCADVMAETLRRSSLGALKKGSKVNLERAMAADGRFGGHIVSGHIDGTGTVEKIKPEGNAVWYTISASSEILHCIVEKGSIAIDGISLTVAKITEKDFSVSIIPHTGANTILSLKQPGDVVNLENDVVGKYVQKFLSVKEDKKTSNIDEAFLGKYGFL
ncbi:MAG: riboflavin synthase [Lachnospiraceae bacterium]|nr:riboflavin synthase [Lachnospiraceae bacterium]